MPTAHAKLLIRDVETKCPCERDRLKVASKNDNKSIESKLPNRELSCPMENEHLGQVLFELTQRERCLIAIKTNVKNENAIKLNIPDGLFWGSRRHSKTK